MLSSAQEVEEPHCSKGLQQQLLSQHAPDVLGQLHEAVKDECGSFICVTCCICSLAFAECLQSRLQAKPMLHMHSIDVKRYTLLNLMTEDCKDKQCMLIHALV